jgi:ferredoxin
MMTGVRESAPEAAGIREATYDIRLSCGLVKNYHFHCREDEPLLAGMRRVGCEAMPRGCAGGGCGICKVVVNSGEVSAFKPMSREHVTEYELAHNVVLACCVNPRSDLEISLFEESWHNAGKSGKGEANSSSGERSNMRNRFDC